VSPTPLDDFLFDLQGFLVVPRAIDAAHVARLNATIDAYPDVPRGGWIGNAQRRDYTHETGFELHNCLETGEAFEELIDHPSWVNHARHYAGDEGTYVEGVFIDECIVSVRTSGGHHPVHSGGFGASTRTQYRYEHGQFRCGQMNVIVALTDIGDGDGPTMVIPGSHKSNMVHPLAGDYLAGDRMDALPGAVPVHLRAGDALLFVDSIMHGGASRTNVEGERRVVILRYGVSWARTRFGYRYSPELLARLSPQRRVVLEPVPPMDAGSDRIPVEAPRVRHRLLKAELN
jgi:ectoine hydroxylase-related dioxygenase (phytanoyl-CoA dioxygenase family)